MLLLVHRALKCLGPKYISYLPAHNEPSRPIRWSRAGFLYVRGKHGEVVFSQYEPQICNQLPKSCRSTATFDSLNQILRLKTPACHCNWLVYQNKGPCLITFTALNHFSSFAFSCKFSWMHFMFTLNHTVGGWIKLWCLNEFALLCLTNSLLCFCMLCACCAELCKLMSHPLLYSHHVLCNRLLQLQVTPSVCPVLQQSKLDDPDRGKWLHHYRYHRAERATER